MEVGELGFAKNGKKILKHSINGQSRMDIERDFLLTEKTTTKDITRIIADGQPEKCRIIIQGQIGW